MSNALIAKIVKNHLISQYPEGKMWPTVGPAMFHNYPGNKSLAAVAAFARNYRPRVLTRNTRVRNFAGHRVLPPGSVYLINRALNQYLKNKPKVGAKRKRNNGNNRTAKRRRT